VNVKDFLLERIRKLTLKKLGNFKYESKVESSKILKDVSLKSFIHLLHNHNSCFNFWRNLSLDIK
jgi:hypothetical protein